MSGVDHALIVIVEDDPAVRGALTFLLELDGYDVEGFASAEALLARTLPARTRCLVLDQRLPGISGLDALRALRARRVTAPAVLITSNPQRALVEAAAQAGVAIVEKPLLGEALLRDIQRALQTHPA